MIFIFATYADGRKGFMEFSEFEAADWIMNRPADVVSCTVRGDLSAWLMSHVPIMPPGVYNVGGMRSAEWN